MKIVDLYQIFKDSRGVNTDSRTIEEGHLFFALSGDNFDGNKYAEEAIKKGAVHAVVSDKSFEGQSSYTVVENTLEVLQKLANYHRHQFTIPFIGITGSNGKTTTKELLYAVLSKKYKTHATKGNLNNHIGVPLTLLAMPEDIEIAIIEMGANKIGDIEELCEIADPDYGLITNIGKAHLEGFGSLEGVARGKSELYMHVLKHGKQIFYNGNEEHLVRMAKRFDAPIQYLGNSEYCAPTLQNANPHIQFLYEGKLVETNLIGDYNFGNIASALCVGKYFEVPLEEAIAGVQYYVPSNNRSEVKTIGTNEIILDAYNANPDSMHAALKNFKGMEAENKLVILGDMFELGKDAQKEHQSIIHNALTNFDNVVFCGQVFYENKSKNGHYFKERSELIKWLEHQEINNTLFLVKGSRGMGLEKVIEAL